MMDCEERVDSFAFNKDPRINLLILLVPFKIAAFSKHFIQLNMYNVKMGIFFFSFFVGM